MIAVAVSATMFSYVIYCSNNMGFTWTQDVEAPLAPVNMGHLTGV
jgi:hypothetical protein